MTFSRKTKNDQIPEENRITGKNQEKGKYQISITNNVTVWTKITSCVFYTGRNKMKKYAKK